MQRTLNDLQVGEAFGRYELLFPVARGGMSMVWAARLCGSRGFQKLVAIKTLKAAKGEHALLERMLLEEARLASQIQHPNVAQYLDLGERDGVLYVVMEWIDGESLGAIMRHSAPRGGIPLGVSLQILTQACKGLHGAHELRDVTGAPLGLVHCDVSPHNLMIGDNGAVRLIDFGIAKATSNQAASRTVAGKLAFMSPEQARNEPLDRRSDLFSLGIVLYLLTTGRHPFPGKTPADMLRAVVQNAQITPPSRIHPSYPRALERAVLRALEHDREARFASAAEMLYALTEAFPAPAPEPEVGAFVQSVAGASLADRRTAITNALRNAEAQAEARAREQRAAQTRAAQARAAEAFAARARANEADGASLRGSQAPVHTSVPAAPEVIRLMQGASTDAPLERDEDFSNSILPRRRRSVVLALSALAVAAAATIVAVRTGAFDRRTRLDHGAPHHGSHVPSRGDAARTAPGADGSSVARPSSRAVTEPASEARASNGARDPAPARDDTAPGCRAGDPTCPKKRSRAPSRAATKPGEREAPFQTGEELEAKFLPDATAEVPTRERHEAPSSPESPSAEPASEKPEAPELPAAPEKSAVPEKPAAPANSRGRYGI